MKLKLKETLNKFNTLLKVSVNKTVLLVGLLSLSWIFFYKLFFINCSPIFIKAQEIGEITFNLLSSVVASCIFYYFVVYLEHRRIARKAYPSLKQRLKTFDANIFNIMLGMHNTKGLTPSFGLPTREKLLELSEGIKLSSRPPEVFGNPPVYTENWFDYFDYLFQSDSYISSLLYAQISFLPASIISKLDEIQFSPFQRALKHYRETQYSDNLSGLINPFYHYLKCLSELSEMADSELE